MLLISVIFVVVFCLFLFKQILLPKAYVALLHVWFVHYIEHTIYKLYISQNCVHSVDLEIKVNLINAPVSSVEHQNASTIFDCDWQCSV